MSDWEMTPMTDFAPFPEQESVDEGAISNATPEGECPVDTPDDDDSSRISDATSDEESDQEIPEGDDEQDTFPRESRIALKAWRTTSTA